MKKHIFKKMIYAFLLMCIASACSEIQLEEDPSSLIDPKKFFKTQAEFEAALVGAYRPLFSDWEGYDYGYDLLMGAGAEDVKSWSDTYKNLDQLSVDDNNLVIKNFWKQHYKSISNSNAIIGNLKNAQGISPERLAELAGQAKFLRAFAFFNLVRFYGEVQLTTFENQDEIDKVKQSSIADIYASIISDLQAAEEGLPANFQEKGRPTKGAAKALLAKVYLTMAGWPLNDNSKYALARDKAAEIMTGQYSLEPKFADLWTQAKKLTTKEFIFTFYGSIEQDGIFGSHYHEATRSSYDGGWGDYFSETRFYKLFPDGPRKEASFTTTFSTGDTFDKLNIDPFIAKYRDAGRVSGRNGEGFRPVLRYADVLLMYAEAANMAEGGPSQKALDALNEVRLRAGTPALAAGISKMDFDKAVLDERNWELAFEGNRWHDLVRRKMVVEVNKDVHPNVKETSQLLPKPGVQLIPGILTQNPGY